MGASGDGTLNLMDEVVSRRNLTAAYERVVRNRGAGGVDGMSVDDLMPYCQVHWPGIREQLLSGCYRPQPVRRGSRSQAAASGCWVSRRCWIG